MERQIIIVTTFVETAGVDKTNCKTLPFPLFDA